MEVSDQLHAPAVLPPGNKPGTFCIRGWGWGHRAGLGVLEKRKLLSMPGIEPGTIQAVA